MKRILILLMLLFPVFLVVSTTTGCIVNKYNTLVDLDEEAELYWGEVEIQYQRRMDLIPSLLSTVKASAAHEHSILVEIEEAQAGIQRASQELGENPTDEQRKDYKAAQGHMTTVLGSMAVVQEQFPELAAPFEMFMVDLAGTENRIAIARQKYNLAATAYNKELRHVGGGQQIVKSTTGQTFTKRELFKAQTGAEVAPKVEF